MIKSIQKISRATRGRLPFFIVLMAALFLTAGIMSGCNKKPKDETSADTGGEECQECDGGEGDYGVYEVEPDDDGYITDPRDGKRYRTIKIGGLMWMAENLNYAGNECWCYDGYEDDDTYCAKYGRLYSWDGAQAACPWGWRVPYVQDWDNLFVAAGGSFDAESHRWKAAGTKLKSKTGWKDKGNGTDDFGFSALPGGFRSHHNGPEFNFAGEGGYWWVSGDRGGSYRAMGWDMSHVNENRLDNYHGFSVRCVRGDADPPAPGPGRRPAPPAAPKIDAATPAGTPDTRWYKPKAKSFTISTADQLAGLAELVNGGNRFAGVTVTLGNDINLATYGKGSAFNDGKGWIPIGISDNNPFLGTFDGGNNKIRGLYINNPELGPAGLFGKIGDYNNQGAAVGNVGVENADITGGSNVGGIVGTSNYSRVHGCWSTGAVNGIDYVGGVAGYMYNGSKLSDSYSAAAVTGDLYVGGVAGDVYDAVSGCWSTGTVSGAADVGGVVGVACGQLTNSYSTGTVSGRAGRVGGVVGRSNCGDVVNCYSTAAISGREGTGGVAGSIIGSTLSNCAALNPSVKSTVPSAGRVFGYTQYANNSDNFSNNTAFISLKDMGGRTEKWTGKGKNNKDGENITVGEIADDGTIGGRFTEDNGWTIEEGKLPGRGGRAVEMPEHLK